MNRKKTIITTIIFCIFCILAAMTWVKKAKIRKKSNLNSPFGVVCHFDIGKGENHIKKDLDLMSGAGIGWRRVNLKWSRYEKNKTYLDNVVLEANKRNINLLIMIILGKYSIFPEQGIKDPKFYRTLQDFEAFIAEISERYDGDFINDAPGSPIIGYWQIENEESGPYHFWKRKKFSSLPGPAAQYVKLLKKAYETIKANQPKAKIVLGGLGGYDRNNYLEAILKAGGGNYFDILDFHIYKDFNSFWNIIKKRKRIARFRTLLKQYGCSKPIWSTEMTAGALDIRGKEKSEKERSLAELVVKRYTVLFSEGVEKAFWKYFDTPNIPRGLLRADLTSTLVYNAYQVMTKKMNGFLYVEDISRADIKIFKFYYNDRKEMYVIWANKNCKVDLGLGTVCITDIFGKKNEGEGPLEVDYSPIYVEKKIK